MPNPCLFDLIIDLIRHGKHARAPTANPASPVVVNQHADRENASPTTSPQRREHKHREREPAPQPPEHALADAAHHTAAQKEKGGQQYKKEAELLVQEERESKAKTPQYPGLDNFDLLEKMGECVLFLLSLSFSLTIFLSSGAFSNVFKAVNKQTGEKVASK